jgi:hypothetical protein
MKKHDVSIPSAKDASILSNLDDLALAIQADARFEKRRRILNPPRPLRPTRFGLFIIGLITGALIAMLIAFVMSVTGVVNGIILILGIALLLGTIGVSMGADK